MAASDYNGSLAVPGYGTWQGYCIQIGHGVNIVKLDEGARSRKGRAFYMTRTTSGSFGITFRLENETRKRQFNEFMVGYARLITNPSSAIKAMTVSVPSRRFLKVAVPNESVGRYGKKAGQYYWDASLLFVGTRDPLEGLDSNQVVSQFQAARFDLIDSPWFYPSSTPLSGSDAVSDGLYRDEHTTTPANRSAQGEFRRDPVTGRTTGRNPGLTG